MIEEPMYWGCGPDCALCNEDHPKHDEAKAQIDKLFGIQGAMKPAADKEGQP